MTRKLVASFLSTTDDQNANRLTLLTAREMEVMQLLAQGLKNREIAERLVISPSTVQTHRSHIMEKLEFDNRSELIHYAMRHDLIDL
jgi:two-component system response regulator NreC